MADSIRLRRDTASDWTAANPILDDGEIGVELDTKKFKVGDGISNWNALTYWLINVLNIPATDLRDILASLTGNSRLAISAISGVDDTLAAFMLPYASRITALEAPARIKAALTTDMPLSNTIPQVLQFNDVIIAHNISNLSGVFTFNDAGAYVGTLELYINRSSMPTVWIFVEKYNTNTSNWEVYRGLATSLKAEVDGVFIATINGSISAAAGDVFRISAIQQGSGSATLESRQLQLGSYNLIQHPAILTLYKI